MNYGPQSPDALRSERPHAQRARPARAELEGGRRDPRFEGSEPYDDDDDDRSPTPSVIDVSEIRGVSKARDRLIPWFRKIVDSVEEAQNPLRVTLVQRVARGGTSPEITTLDHDLETPPDETINSLIQLAVEDMCEAHFTGTKLTYALIVPLSNGNNSVQNFPLEIPRSRGTTFVDPPRAQHFPDSNGVISHFMDRDLQLTQFALEGASRGTEVLERDIERKLEEIRQLKLENQRLRGSQFDRDREMQRLLDGNMKREFMAEEHRSKIDRDQKIGEGFKAIMPQLLPFLLPPQMAQALAVPLAMASANAQSAGAGPQADASAATMRDDDGSSQQPVDMASMPGMPGMGNDTALIDELIREFEEDQVFFVKLFTMMGERPRCAELLAMLYQSSRIRQQRRAQIQAEQAASATSK